MKNYSFPSKDFVLEVECDCTLSRLSCQDIFYRLFRLWGLVTGDW